MATHDPLVDHSDAYGPTYGIGHGDAHDCLGAGGIAVAQTIRADGLKARVKVFGSAGEEQLASARPTR
ncbi:hypothetical protein [Streptomyces sp. NPDC088707]|uniref:hypothetical protein n=1 Tax=Streptomyces sp. NPDC088707 TaxID=3365871 RepID=UPI0037F3C2B9